MRKYLFICLLAVIMLVAAACGNSSSNTQPTSNGPTNTSTDNSNASEGAGEVSSEEVIELSYAFFAPAGTFPAVQMEKWAEEMEKRTNGKVKVNTFPGGTLLTAENMYDGVATGMADIGLSVTSYEPGRFPLIEIADMPSGFPNSTVASKVMAQLINEFEPNGFEDYKVITVFSSEAAYIQTQEPVESLEDLKGKQLRIPGGAARVLEALGASPVGMSQAEVAEALQTGIVNGYVSSREVLQDLKYAEMVSYITDYPLTLTTFVAVMNKNKWESLPDDVKQVIDELNAEMTAFTGEYFDSHVQGALKWSEEEHGVSVVTLKDEEKWKAITDQIQQEKVQAAIDAGLPGQEFRDRLYELIEQYSKE